MTDVYLIRHSHVDYGEGMAITADNPLTPLGHEMAARLAERLAALGPEILFASTMRRARETADIVCERLPQLPRVNLDALRETCIDDLVGYPGDMPPADLRTWDGAHFGYASAQHYLRTERAWNEMLETAAARGHQRIAAIAHGASINMLFRHFVGVREADLTDWFIELDWTSISALRIVDGGAAAGAFRRLVRWVNDARHIDDLRHRLSD